MSLPWLLAAIGLSVVLLVDGTRQGVISAATFDVADGDVAGLITAINLANANAEPDTINLAPNGTYTLMAVDNLAASCQAAGNGLPAITTEILINGNGAVIERGAASPEFRLLCVEETGILTLDHVTIRGGSVSSHGGGIYNDFGRVILIATTVRGNQANFGGGIFNDSEFFADGMLSLQDSTVADNLAVNGRGGGIFSFTSTLNVVGSTISGNVARSNLAQGGGIYISAGTTRITNSTISGNTAEGQGNVASGGGGLYYTFGDPNGVSIESSTISDNRAENGSGGGIRIEGGEILLKNTLVADNPSGDDCSALGVFSSLGNNLDGDGTCNLDTGLGDLIGVDPRLGPLQDNGGPTETHALQDGSAAIDAGSDDCPPPADDQRSVERPEGPACDIGAFEREEEPEPEPRLRPMPPPNLGAVLGPVLASDTDKNVEDTAPSIKPPNTGTGGLIDERQDGTARRE